MRVQCKEQEVIAMQLSFSPVMRAAQVTHSAAGLQPDSHSDRQDPEADRANGAITQESDLKNAAQNLLVHIPGEASGFYLMVANATETMSTGNALLYAALALAILFAARWVADSTWPVMLTSAVAFFIWMAVLEDGALSVAGYGLPGVPGLAIAAGYSILVAIIATKRNKDAKKKLSPS
jgi:hypothetical protein